MPRWRDPQLRGIRKKGLKYWYRHQLTPEQHARLGGPVNILIPLNTADLVVAIQRAAEAREQVQRKVKPGVVDMTFSDVLADHMDRLDAFAGEVQMDSGEGTDDPDRYAASAIVDELEERKGFDVAKRFHDISHGIKTPIEALLKSYELERDASPKNLQDKRWAVKRAGIKYLEDVPSKRKAGAITTALMQDENLSRNSVASVGRELSALWSHAENKELVEINPWKNLRIKKTPTEKRALTREELQTIMTATANIFTQHTKVEIVFLLRHTSLRAGELLALAVDDIEWDGDEPSFLVVRDSKTDASNRRVPLAPVCRPIVRKMWKGNHRGKLYRWSHGKLWEDVRHCSMTSCRKVKRSTCIRHGERRRQPWSGRVCRSTLQLPSWAISTSR